MGTHAITIFLDEGDTEICRLYRQYDGFLTGHGEELKKALVNGKMVNGIDNSPGQKFNGSGDLAVQVIAYLKQTSVLNKIHHGHEPELKDLNVLQAGGLYLYPAGEVDSSEYEYVVSPGQIGKPPNLIVRIYANEIFNGSIKDFDPSRLEEETNED